MQTWRASRHHKHVLWPKDILANHFPQARILTYGYDGEMLRERSRIRELTSTMAYSTIACREDVAVNRPIIWVAHSLGGLLVKSVSYSRGALVLILTQMVSIQVLEHCWTCSKLDMNSEAASIFKATAGIIFLGTPHQATSSTSWLKHLTVTSGNLPPDSQEKMLKLSEEYQRDAVSFRNVLDQSNILIVSFYETKATSTKTGSVKVRESYFLLLSNLKNLGHRFAHSIESFPRASRLASRESQNYV
jgi:hypothetical protein